MAVRTIAVTVNHSQTECGKNQKGDEKIESKRIFLEN